MNENQPEKVFHLAITMAGAVSAGAYTAGVMDYLLETLDKWDQLKKEAREFFRGNPDLQDLTWEDLEKMNLEPEELRKAKLYNAVPTHDVKIEILSGASAGGMTAAITSFVLHQKEKFPVRRNLKHQSTAETEENEEARKRNRLYHSWVNLTGQSDMLPVLLNNSDITKNPRLPFPLSLFNSKFIREISRQALEIKDHDELKLADYVADNFNLFVTLTNLKGFAKSISVNRVEQRYQTDFITYDHRDLMMFDFCDESTPGIINVNFCKSQSCENYEINSDLLSKAAVSTGAFPIGLEYNFINREADYINLNPLLNRRGNNLMLVKNIDHNAVFVDGGLINNEPFDLTKELLELRLANGLNRKIFGSVEKEVQKKMRTASEQELTAAINDELKKRAEQHLKENKYNRTILMIDPFPSERLEESDGYPEGYNAQYPYSFLGAIFQLLGTMRTQLLVKSDLIEDGFNSDLFDCFLIAPRRRVFQTDAKGKRIKKNDRFQPVYERNSAGEVIRGADGKRIPKAYDGSAAIACGSLAGFGGFLSREFREHDFFLGKINCKSFLRHHFRIETNIRSSVVHEGYRGAAAKIFKISQTRIGEDQKEITEHFFPLVPDVEIIEKILNDELDLKDVQSRRDIDTLYGELDYPEYSINNFQKHYWPLRKRLWQVVNSIIRLFEPAAWWKRWFWRSLLKPFIWFQFSVIYFFGGFNAICQAVKKQLDDWQLLKKEKTSPK